jgi:hypothetical protein
METSSKLHASVGFTNPDEIATFIAWIGGRLDLSTGLDAVEERKLTTSVANLPWFLGPCRF